MAIITLDLSDDGRESLDKLKELTGCKSDDELIDAALSLLETTATEVAAGRPIVSIDQMEKAFHEVSLPAFDNIVRNRVRH